jgi:hypothetical protein
MSPPFIFGYKPFLHALPIWDYWYLLIVPLCLGISIVYKSMKCPSMRQVPRQAAVITVWILAAMAAAGAVLVIVVKIHSSPT